MEDRLRLFIAVKIPEVVKTQFERAQATLRRALPEATVRWTKREQFHLTLKFLGSVEAKRVPALVDAVQSAAKNFPPLQLRAAQVGSFPGWRRPRVIWVGIEDAANQLGPLQHAIDMASREFTSEKPEDNFTGHVTLGRIKSIRPQKADQLAQAAAGLATEVFGTWTAAEIEILRSELSQSGARHTMVASIPLPAQGECKSNP
jgi:2'-5' RNA ligase